MGRTSAPRRRVAVLSTATRRWSPRGREVLLGKQDLQKSETAFWPWPHGTFTVVTLARLLVFGNERE